VEVLPSAIAPARRDRLASEMKARADEGLDILPGVGARDLPAPSIVVERAIVVVGTGNGVWVGGNENRVWSPVVVCRVGRIVVRVLRTVVRVVIIGVGTGIDFNVVERNRYEAREWKGSSTRL
jgi:hypothetical protein